MHGSEKRQAGLITPVILCGGSGTRLWPLSREERPKQLLALTGERTMLQMTAARVSAAELFGPPILVVGERHAGEVRAQVDAIRVGEAHLVIEPCARNTAPAIALAALHASADDLLLVLPSDHLIGDQPAFHAAIAAAAPFARDGSLVTFGIRPVHPETGYGYIARGEEVASGIFRVRRFVEKPDLETAKSYLADGAYEWNAGIFLFRAGAYLAALAEFAPDILEATRAAFEAGERDEAQTRPDGPAFNKVRSRSIDHAVMEQAGNILVCPLQLQWSDIGSWDALYEVSARDEAGNALGENAYALDASGCLLRSDGPSIVVVGARDLVVIATEEATLVIPRGETQRVKEAVELLRANGASSGWG